MKFGNLEALFFNNEPPISMFSSGQFAAIASGRAGFVISSRLRLMLTRSVGATSMLGSGSPRPISANSSAASPTALLVSLASRRTSI